MNPEDKCPRCNGNAPEKHFLPSAIKKRLADGGNAVEAKFVCGNCYTQLMNQIAQGSVLMMRAKAEEHKKMMLWKSRMSFIKKARVSMEEKIFSEAAVAYEKYLRVLEMVFGVQKNELKPEMFKDSARTQELTVVASTYWDLARIYDSNEKYEERQLRAFNKLSEFLRFTPIFPDVLRKAEELSKTARNQIAFKNFLKKVTTERPRCFIATATFDNPFSWEVQTLACYRDLHMQHQWWGPSFIETYYKFSPHVATFLDRNKSLKTPLRKVLTSIANQVNRDLKNHLHP